MIELSDNQLGVSNSVNWRIKWSIDLKTKILQSVDLQDFSFDINSSGGIGSPLEHLVVILAIIREMYGKSERTNTNHLTLINGNTRARQYPPSFRDKVATELATKHIFEIYILSFQTIHEKLYFSMGIPVFLQRYFNK